MPDLMFQMFMVLNFLFWLWLTIKIVRDILGDKFK